MQCPWCGEDNDKVIDSRSSEGGRCVRRRRHCQSCSRRFTTYERAEETHRLAVVKKDGSREPYQREKLVAGLEKACYKRPVRSEQIRQAVDATEEKIFQSYDKDVPSKFIGDTLAVELRKIDKVAYLRFATVYLEFDDVGQLISEAREVEAEPGRMPGQKELFE